MQKEKFWQFNPWKEINEYYNVIVVVVFIMLVSSDVSGFLAGVIGIVKGTISLNGKQNNKTVEIRNSLSKWLFKSKTTINKLD